MTPASGRPLRARTVAGAAIAGVVCLAAACGPTGDPGAAGAPTTSSGGPTDAPTGEVVVLAAASLAEPYEALAAELEDRHPELDVTVSTGPSSALAAQVAAGAPADVLATASAETMAVATDALRDAEPGREVGEPVVVATNTMTLAVPGPSAPGGQGAVASLADLEGVRLAVCRPEVPCGAGAAAVLGAAGVAQTPVTYENDVGAVLTKVALGEVDAGLVYVSDVHASAPLVAEGRVVGVPIEADVPPDARWTTSYPVLGLPDAPNPAGARAVVDLLASERGHAVLRDAGFGPPP